MRRRRGIENRPIGDPGSRPVQSAGGTENKSCFFRLAGNDFSIQVKAQIKCRAHGMSTRLTEFPSENRGKGGLNRWPRDRVRARARRRWFFHTDLERDDSTRVRFCPCARYQITGSAGLIPPAAPAARAVSENRRGHGSFAPHAIPPPASARKLAAASISPRTFLAGRPIVGLGAWETGAMGLVWPGAGIRRIPGDEEYFVEALIDLAEFARAAAIVASS